MTKRKLKRYLEPVLFCGPYLLFFALFVLTPFVMAIVISFFKWDFLTDAKFVGFSNYASIFNFTRESFLDTWGGQFWKYLGNTMLFVAIETPILIIIPLILATLLNKKIKGGMISRAIIYFPCILSISTVALIWFLIFNPNEHISWTLSQPSAWIAIFILSSWWGLGGNTTLFLAGLQGISKELYEACEVDGGGTMSKFFHVTVPGLAPTFGYAVIMTIISTFNVIGQPLMLTNGGPDDTTTVVVQHIYKFGNGGRYGEACSMSVILGCVMLVFSIIAYVMIKKKEVRVDE